MNRLLDDAKPCAIVSVLACFRKGRPTTPSELHDVPFGFETWTSKNHQNCLAFKRRDVRLEGRSSLSRYPSLMILGDAREWALAGKEPLGNATSITCDLENDSLDALTAIPGLPPLFWVETNDQVVLTSDLFLLKCVPAIHLRFDVEGVMDFIEIGRPIGHSTLFQGVRLVPAGTRFRLGANGVRLQSAWQLPEWSPRASWDEYTELQAGTFAREVARVGGPNTALSLTAGLDSRAILAGLIANKAPVLAITGTGDTLSLDARVASRLCKEYGIQHRAVALDESFWSRLPELANQASLLSGGLASISHSAQLHCYRAIGFQINDKMLSGHLGNQIGRLGTEGLTPRCADTTILSQQFARQRVSARIENWYTKALRPDGLLEPRFLVQEEAMFAGLCSYLIGNSCTIQQAPYASRTLIDNLSQQPAAEPHDGTNFRFRDLKHRFVGVPLERSFQRRYINEVGGLLARYQINWGWRSQGGVSISGLLWGGLALTDAVVSTRLASKPALGLMRSCGISGLHEIRPERQRPRVELTAFVNDTLTSQRVVQSGLFDGSRLIQRLKSHSSGERIGWDKSLLSAMDLALAARNFHAAV